MTARRVLAGVLAACAVLAGCGTDDGDKSSVTRITEYTEPSSSTSRPARTPSSTSPTTTTTSSSAAPSTSAGPPPGAQTLPTENGYAFLQTKSGRTRCQLNATEVDCEAPFTDPPTVDGNPANGVRLTTDGQTQWVSGNLGDIPAVTLDYRTYWAFGWTIEAREDGTRFTNDRTRHGMTVAVQGVQTF